MMQYLQEYSTRGWAYRNDQGWVFDELTPKELEIFRRVPMPTTGYVRVPKGRTFRLYNGLVKDFIKYWFGYCTLTELHPLALALFRLCRLDSDGGRTDEIIEYPLKPAIYGGWLWNDEAALCVALGCNLTVHDGLGWDDLLPPTKLAPRIYLQPERTFIYALVDPCSHKVRYIGKADDPQRRFGDHLQDTSNRWKKEWIQGLQAQGQIPILNIIEEVDSSTAFEREH